MQDSPSNPAYNSGDHWITIASAIAVVIISLIQPLIQVLFSTWLKKKQRSLSAANPDMNQPSGWKRKILDLLNRIPPTVPPLIAIALSIASLFYLTHPLWIARQADALLIGVYLALIAWNLAVYYLNKATRKIDSRIDAITDVLKMMVKSSSKGSEDQNEDSKTLSELQFEAFKELHAWLKNLEARLQVLETLQEKKEQKPGRKKPTPLD